MITERNGAHCAYCFGYIPKDDIRITNFTKYNFPRFPIDAQAHLECFVEELKDEIAFTPFLKDKWIKA